MSASGRSQTLGETADKFAVFLSVLCVVHCLATPLLLIMLPALAGTMFVSEEVHRWLLYAVLPISIVALSVGFIDHRQRSVLIIGAIGLSVLSFTVFLGHDTLGHELEVVFTMIGALIVAFAHVKNIRLGKQTSQL